MISKSVFTESMFSKSMFGRKMFTKKMFSKTKTILLVAMVIVSSAGFRQYATPSSPGPEYTSDAQLKFPEHYRDWVYLTTGFDMSYNPALQMADHHMFDNVFVNPEAYKAFVETGTWPDKTILVLEARGAEGKGSINQKGNYQGTEVMAVEVHVKDEARFPGKWAFFGFDEGKTAKMIPTSMTCYSCHADHAAVDTTFVQFYPTLLPIAKSKGTLSAAYQKEVAAPQK
jgi:Cytochrome P460